MNLEKLYLFYTLNNYKIVIYSNKFIIIKYDFVNNLALTLYGNSFSNIVATMGAGLFVEGFDTSDSSLELCEFLIFYSILFFLILNFKNIQS